MPESTIVITCSLHQPEILKAEVEALGYTVNMVKPLSIELQGTLQDCMRLNLHLRSATKVLFFIKGFKAKHPNELYKNVRKIAWEDIFDINKKISIDSYVSNQFINDSRFANLRVKDGIVDRFVTNFDKRPNSGPERDEVVIFIHWKEDNCGIYINTTGEPISKHGYRISPYKAPMIESLAAATLLSMNWNKNTTFINPMCGSGTIAIEAALMARNIPSQWSRENFGFMHLKAFDPEQWKKIRSNAAKKIKLSNKVKIIANDISKEAIECAKTNAERAGVLDMISFFTGDFNDIRVPEEDPGIVIFNPEYGMRLGDINELRGTYAEMGDFFKKKCGGYTGYIFTGNLELAKHIGLRTKSRKIFMNGRIECRLLEYELYAGSRKDT